MAAHPSLKFRCHCRKRYTVPLSAVGRTIACARCQSKVEVPPLGALAGVPTILGCWIGAFTYSTFWSLLFLGVGAGAIVQVIGAIVGRRPLAETLAPLNLAGLLAGYLLMYGTGLLVGAV